MNGARDEEGCGEMEGGRDTLARLLVSNCERREREREGERVTRKRARELAHLRAC